MKLEESIQFIYKNIQVGISYAKGGSSMPEYPEALIRENVNNALAHRKDGIKPNFQINENFLAQDQLGLPFHL